MFLLPCGDTVPHPAHEHVRHWEKAKLGPRLKDADSYPESWDAKYRCPGITPVEAKATQWFAYWQGVQASVQHWANGIPMRCPYDTPQEAHK